MCFILSDLICYESIIWSFRNHFLSAMQKEKCKNNKKKKALQLIEFFFPPLFGALLFSNLISFLFLIHFKRFKLL
jgi:hypothetical protein